MKNCVLAIDQSTQGTKGLLFDENGALIAKAERSHRQIVNDKGWVEHDPEEILRNVYKVCEDVIKRSGFPDVSVSAIGISNQRETSLMWDRLTGKPIYNAIVWQCSRGTEICGRKEISSYTEAISEKTGLRLSPYFPAVKLAWIMENLPEAKELARQNRLCCGTVDTWLVYSLTNGKRFKTDYSNASRTMLFNISKLKWDDELCELFNVPINSLPEVCMSDSDFGVTDINGLLYKSAAVHSVLGDSHGALFGQNCRRPGQIKATYGTGSSVMMNIGTEPKMSENGLVTSIAWGMSGKIQYAFEGNLNYAGAVITWLKKDVGLIKTDREATEMAYAANPLDRSYFVPAFTGLGAPYWDSRASGILTGISRITGRNEIARACLDCIAYQITDLLNIMEDETGLPITALKTDGGPTESSYLMQFQSDISGVTVQRADLHEISGTGAAYAAGIAAGIYDENKIYVNIMYTEYFSNMNAEVRKNLYSGWKKAVSAALSGN